MTEMSIGLLILCGLMVLYINGLHRALRLEAKKTEGLSAPYVPRVNLLGVPEDAESRNNDMLMQVARDLLVQDLSCGQPRHYAPNGQVVERLRLYQRTLRPHRNKLRELGYAHVDYFIDELLHEYRNGERYVPTDFAGIRTSESVAALAEVSALFAELCGTQDGLKAEIDRKLYDKFREEDDAAMRAAGFNPRDLNDRPLYGAGMEKRKGADET